MARSLVGSAVAIAVVLPAAGAATSASTTVPLIPSAAGQPPAPSGPSAAGPSIISVASVAPTVAVPGAPVTITGTITARQRALTTPTVSVVLGKSPIRSRADVGAWAGDTSDLSGPPVASAATSASLPPGASAPFTLTIPGGKLSMSRSWGVVPIALQVTDADPANHDVVRTFVGWQRSKEYQPLSLAVVAPITLSASPGLFDATATTRTDAWRSEVGPGSRIDRIISGTDSGGVPVTWAIDPAVLGRDRRSPAQVSADPVTALVAPLRTRIADASTRHTLWALPYGDADLAATVADSPTDPTVAAQVQRSGGLGPALGVPVKAGVAWFADGGLPPLREQGLLTTFGKGNLAAALVSSSALPTESGFTGSADRKSPSGVPLLAWDDELSRLTLQTRSVELTAVTTQQFIAETAALLAESPGIDRAVVVAMPRTIDPDPASLAQFLRTLAVTPWVQFVSTDRVQAQAATRDPVSRAGESRWTVAGPPQMDARRLEQIAAERQTIDRVAALFPDGPGYRTQWNDTLDQLTSTRWRDNPPGLATLTATAAGAGTQATKGIHVTDQTTNFLADEGVLQVTVVNDLDVPVEGVRLVLTPANPRMRIVSEPAPIRIEKQSKATVQVRARAIAAGLVPVNASLTTSDGTPIGVGGTITVRANPPGRAFYVIAGVIVALFLVVGIVRNLRHRSSDAS